MRSKLSAFALSFVLVSSLAFTTGCGKSKATDEQIAQLSQTLGSASRVKTSIPSKGAGFEGTAITRQFAAVNWANTVASGGPKDHSAAKMQERLDKERSANECTITMPDFEQKEPTATFGTSIPQFDIQVGGDACPIKLSLSMLIKLEASAMDVSFKCKYEVVDNTYLELNDVSAMDLTGSVVVKQSSDSEVSGDINFSGTIHSQKNGDVKVEITGDVSGDQSSQKMSVTAAFEFADFEIELKQEQEDGKDTYFINDEEVTQKEFFDAFGNITGAGSASSSESSESYTYDFTYNGCETKKQSFSSHAKMCEGVQSDSLNHGCAEPTRREYFKEQKCPGTFTRSA